MSDQANSAAAFVLPAHTRDEILERLTRQPYADVHELVAQLQALPPAHVDARSSFAGSGGAGTTLAGT